MVPRLSMSQIYLTDFVPGVTDPLNLNNTKHPTSSFFAFYFRVMFIFIDEII